jgi:hypothetical protein
VKERNWQTAGSLFLSLVLTGKGKEGGGGNFLITTHLGIDQSPRSIYNANECLIAKAAHPATLQYTCTMLKTGGGGGGGVVF